MYNLPQSTIVNRVIPKKTFVNQLGANTRIKDHFTNDVVRVEWLAKLAPSTINVADGKEVHEITIFLVPVKDENCPDDIFSFIDDKRIVRPANYTKGLPGNDYSIVNKNNKRIAVINLIGRTSMGILSENPFIVANDIYNKLKNQADIFVLDFHAEATAEKIAMGYYMDGKYTIVYGTHTHVQTADEQILEKGTAYITDIGMTGPKKSVIGMDVDVSFKRFVTSLPERYKLADSEAMINGCVFKINDETNRTEEIIRINNR